MENQTYAGLSGANKLGSSLNAPVAVSTTEQQTISLHETVSQVDKLVSLLHDRLHSVMRERDPQNTSGSDVAQESLPPLANAIRQSRYVAQGCVGRLNDILDRLDI